MVLEYIIYVLGLIIICALTLINMNLFKNAFKMIENTLDEFFLNNP